MHGGAEYDGEVTVKVKCMNGAGSGWSRQRENYRILSVDCGNDGMANRRMMVSEEGYR